MIVIIIIIPYLLLIVLWAGAQGGQQLGSVVAHVVNLEQVEVRQAAGADSLHQLRVDSRLGLVLQDGRVVQQPCLDALRRVLPVGLSRGEMQKPKKRKTKKEKRKKKKKKRKKKQEEMLFLSPRTWVIQSWPSVACCGWAVVWLTYDHNLPKGTLAVALS